MTKQAELYRMVMDDHICPFGLKAKALLEREGYTVDDHPLRSRAATDVFKEEHGVATTPQVFIAGKRIGGYDALREHLGYAPAGKTLGRYQPVIAIFVMAALGALALIWATGSGIGQAIICFVALAMCLLALQKLKDVEQFSNMFIGYDLLAQRVVPYAYIYPFAEAGAGLLMLAGAFMWLAGPVSLFIGAVGAVSVIKAVYIDQRELSCACVGGDSDVPLGAVSLTENLMMAGMGAWMTWRAVAAG